MVGRYPAIQLMSREPIRPLVTHFNINRCLSISHGGLVAVSAGYPPGTGMLLTRYAPLRRSPPTGIATRRDAPRLACVKPAASVHPEPGSNSSLYISISLCLSGGINFIALLACTSSLFKQLSSCFSRAPAASVCGRSFPHYRKVTAEHRALTSLHLLRDIPGCLTDTLISPGHCPFQTQITCLLAHLSTFRRPPFRLGIAKVRFFYFPPNFF